MDEQDRVDEQDRPAEGTKPGSTNSAMLLVGALFAGIGLIQLVGPGDGGIAFLVIGLVLLASAGVRLRR